VVDFGAVGDGKTLDTAAITKAILAVADAGWGTVLFPVCRGTSKGRGRGKRVEDKEKEKEDGEMRG
jgi:polygalacturonase